IGDAVAVVDPAGLVTRANRAFAALFRRAPDDVVGRAIADISHDVARIIEARGPDTDVGIRDRRFAVRVDEIPGEAPTRTWIVVTLRDMTAARRAEAERAEAYERERTISLTLQQSLLPEGFPRQERIDVDAWFVPAERELIVGGDWYDVIETEGAFWLVI